MTTGTTLTATYRIATPMFCAGANHCSAELRLPSFKGALRFWWRSLMWGKVQDHHELREREAQLFGSSDSKAGQSKVRLRVVSKNLGNVEGPPNVFEKGGLLGAHYLGYGVMEAFPSRPKKTKAGQLTRGMLDGGTFSIECRLSPLATVGQIDEVERALILLGTVGGLGAKARKGFGSLTLTELRRDEVRRQISTGPAERLRAVVENPPSGLPEWTAWSSLARVVVAQSSDVKRAVQLLDLVGREQVRFRSWGRNGNVLDKSSERNFPMDHDLSKGYRVPIDYPSRVAFGLPHNYGRESVQPEAHGRRASPLFIHIDQPTADIAPTAVIIFLPAMFLPASERLRAFGKSVTMHCGDEFWFPLHAFLDRLAGSAARSKARPGYDKFPNDGQWCQKTTSLVAQELYLG